MVERRLLKQAFQRSANCKEMAFPNSYFQRLSKPCITEISVSKIQSF